MNWFKALSPRSRVAYQYILPRFYCQMDAKEQGKKNAGYAAVDNHIKVNNCCIKLIKIMEK